MSYTVEEVYTIARQCSKLEHAALAVTLTNNPAQGLSDTLAAEAVAMQAALGTDASVIEEGETIHVHNASDATDIAGTVTLASGQPVVHLPGDYGVLQNGQIITVDDAPHVIVVENGVVTSINPQV